MRKVFVTAALAAGLLISLPVEAPAQTYGDLYGGYGNNGYLDRALSLRRSKRKARSSKSKARPARRVYRKKSARRSNRSNRRARR